MPNKLTNNVTKYTAVGAIFGTIFPVLSTTLEVHNLSYPNTLASFILVQRSNVLLWIIDLAIPILAYCGYLIGRRQQALVEQAVKLDEIVEDRSEEILRQKLFYEALVENSPIAIVTLDADHRILSANPVFEEIFGFKADVIMGENLDDLISSETTQQEAHQITKSVLSGNTVRTIGRRRRADGSFVDVEILGKPINIDGQLAGVLGLYRDITTEKKSRDEIEASEARFRSLFQDSPVALRLEDCSDLRVWVTEKCESSGLSFRDYIEKHPQELAQVTALPKIISLNSATLSLFNAHNSSELQEQLGHIISEDSRESVIDIVSALIAGETSIEQELVYETLDGTKKYVITRLTVLPGYESDWSRVLFSNMDITDRKLAEDRMSFISLHDSMTGLYNRAFFDEELTRLEKSRIRPISVIVCDMDNLKKLNDEHGHKAGDIALQNIARILEHCLRAEDVIARIGGDEFSVLLPQVSADLARRICMRIVEDITKHNMASSDHERISLSIGCATAEMDENLIDAFKTADSRMYQQKQEKKGTIR